jgi:hypothetical protein
MFSATLDALELKMEGFLQSETRFFQSPTENWATL